MSSKSIRNSPRVKNDIRNKCTNAFRQLLTSSQQITLVTAFGLLLILVILGCTLSPSPFISVVLVIGLMISFIAVLYPPIALLLVFVGAGLPSLLIPLPGHTVRVVELALLLCFIIIILRFPYLQLRLRLPHFLGLLFVAIAIISFIHVPEISANLNDYGANKRLYEITLTIAAFYCGTLFIKYVKNVSSFLVAALLANIPLYLVGLAQALSIHLPTFLESSDAQNPQLSEGRLWGPTPGAATFGLYLVNLFAVALACWLLGNKRRDRIIGAAMVTATALEIIGSGTRSASVAMIFLVIISLILTRRFKVLFATTAITGVLAYGFLNKVTQLFTHDASSTSNRLFLSQEAIKLIISHPWIGIGLEQFPNYYKQLIVSQGAQLNGQGISIHEQYLEFAMESGVTWLIVGVLLLISIIFFCWQAYRIAQRKQQIIFLAAILAVLGNMVTSFFDVPLDKVEGTVFLFLLAGLALGYAEHIRWSMPIQKVFASIPLTSVVQSIRTIDIGTRLYPPRIRRPSANQPISSQPGSSNPAEIASVAPDAQKTSRTILIQLISWGIAIPIIFPVTALLTRYLGPIQYGEYSFTFPFFGVFALLSGTGMDPLIIRQLSRKKRAEWSSILSYALGSRLFSCALSALAAALIAFVLPVSAEQRTLLLLGSVSLLFSFSFNGMRMIFSYGFRAEQRAGVLFLIETTNRVVTAGLVLLVVLLHLSIIWAYCLLVYSDIPFFIMQVIVARRRYNLRLRFNMARMREHLIGSLSMTGYDALALINGQVDVLLLLVLAGPLSVGIYALAMRITDPLLSIAFAYFSGVYPLLCKKFEEGKEQFSLVYQEATRILALGIIPLTVYVSVEADAIVSLLGGPRFAVAAIAVRLLMYATAIAFFHGLAVRSCTAANLERKSPYITAVSTGTNVIVNLLLIPHLQFTGAAIAAVASELVGLSLYSLLLRRHVYLVRICSVMLRVLSGNMPMLAFLLWQKQAPLLLSSPIAFALCIIGCAATRVISTRDIAMMRGMLFSRQSKKLSPEFVDQPTLTIPRIEKVFDLPTLVVPRVGEVSDLPTLVLPRIEEFPDLPTLILARIEI